VNDHNFANFYRKLPNVSMSPMQDAGGFEGDVGVEAAGDSAVDDGLLLLVEQRDELLRPNRPLNPPVRIEKRTMASCSSVVDRALKLAKTSGEVFRSP
jgi:hypothetical protein